MDCPQVTSRLSAYSDGELPPEAKALVDRHLEVCAGCLATLARLQTVDKELDRLTDVEVKPYFGTRLHQRIADRRHNRATGWFRRVAVPAGAAVVMLLAAVAGTQLGRGLYGRRSSSLYQNAVAVSQTGTLDLLDGPGGSFYVAGGQ